LNATINTDLADPGWPLLLFNVMTSLEQLDDDRRFVTFLDKSLLAQLPVNQLCHQGPNSLIRVFGAIRGCVFLATLARQVEARRSVTLLP
jgi:hypothetical protein